MEKQMHKKLEDEMGPVFFEGLYRNSFSKLKLT